MSKIVDTDIGRFRQVTDDKDKWFLFECPVCGEFLPMDEETLAGRAPITHESQTFPASLCTYGGCVELGKVLVSTMQAMIVMGYKPYHDEGQSRWLPSGGGVDGPM